MVMNGPDKIFLLEDLLHKGPGGSKEFLWAKEHKLSLYKDGVSGPHFTHSVVYRRHLDAAVIIAHYKDSKSRRRIYLRSCYRPAIGLRFAEDGNMWELPAGLIEDGEDPAVTAQRETWEELGFSFSDVNQFKPLGSFTYPTVGLMAERLFFFSVQVKPKKRKEPNLDGSIIESAGQITTVTLRECRRLLKSGYFKNGTTELGIRRFLDGHG